jgi:hypothetical protein
MSGPVTVTEQISLLDGSADLLRRSYPATWTGGAVEDQLSKQFGGNIYQLQQFVGIVTGGIDVFPAGLAAVPLIILERSGFEHGTLAINMHSNHVDISDVSDVGDCKK